MNEIFLLNLLNKKDRAESRMEYLSINFPHREEMIEEVKVKLKEYNRKQFVNEYINSHKYDGKEF